MSSQCAPAASVALTTAGTCLPLDANQNLCGFIADTSNEAFTVPEDGTYLVSYHVEPETATQMTTQILQNDTPLAGTEVSPAAAATNYSATTLANLKANDALSLQLVGSPASITLTKADLTAVRLS